MLLNGTLQAFTDLGQRSIRATRLGATIWLHKLGDVKVAVHLAYPEEVNERDDSSNEEPLFHISVHTRYAMDEARKSAEAQRIELWIGSSPTAGFKDVPPPHLY